MPEGVLFYCGRQHCTKQILKVEIKKTPKKPDDYRQLVRQVCFVKDLNEDYKRTWYISAVENGAECFQQCKKSGVSVDVGTHINYQNKLSEYSWKRS